MIISISGPDGVGKTTHVNILVNETIRKGYKVKKVWIKNNHTIAYLIIMLLKYISDSNIVMLSSKSILTNILAYSNKRLWLWIDSLSVLIKLITSIYVPRLLGYIVIADRYLLDTIVAMVLTVRDFKALKCLPVKFLLYRLRKDNTLLVALDCSFESIKSRRKEQIEPYVVIKWQRLLYRVLARMLNIPIIYADKSVAKVHSEILKHIKV